MLVSVSVKVYSTTVGVAEELKFVKVAMPDQATAGAKSVAVVERDWVTGVVLPEESMPEKTLSAEAEAVMVREQDCPTPRVVVQVLAEAAKSV